MLPLPISDVPLRRTVWLTVALFLAYLCVAMSLPVTSVYVTTDLGYGNALAGLAVGIAFGSTILTRGAAGRLTDGRGGKRAMIYGLIVYTLAGIVCAAAAIPGLPARVSFAILIAGRLLQGVGESIVTVSVIGWTLGIMGPPRSGRVFALIGIGMYGAFAAGGPLGIVLFDWGGYGAVMGACTLVPLVGLVMALAVPPVAPQAGARQSFWSIVTRILQPSLVVCMQGVGFAAIGAFVPLLFLSRGWPHAGLGLTCFGGAFVLVRVLFGHLPDRVGGIPVALVSMAVEAVGQILLWTAPSPAVALAGAFMTGLGCSLIFPAMGLEVVRRIPPHLRGTATGAFAAFQDLAYGLTGPITGLLADRYGYGIVFAIGAICAALGFALVVALAGDARRQQQMA